VASDAGSSALEMCPRSVPNGNHSRPFHTRNEKGHLSRSIT
jgi:hypothetical protein